jgi:TPR repeat protein
LILRYILFIFSAYFSHIYDIHALSPYTDRLQQQEEYSETFTPAVEQDFAKALLRLLHEESSIQTEMEAIYTLKRLASLNNYKPAVTVLNKLKAKEIESLTGMEGEGKFLKLKELASQENAKALLILGDLYWGAESFKLLPRGKGKLYIEKSADAGLGLAKVALYHYLMKVEKDYDEAFKVLYSGATVVAHRDAMFTLAMHYKNIEKNDERFVKWLVKAANKEHPKAMKILASFKNKMNAEKESVKAMLREAANNGDEKAKQKLAALEEKEPTTEEYIILKDAAIGGEPMAQLELAKYLYTHKNSVRGRKWVEKAAEQNYPDALFRMARIYEDFDFNYKEANKLYKRAIEQNHVRSMNALGINYVKGNGTQKDLPEAMRLYHMAAEGGNVSSQASLGYRYTNGQDLPKDVNKGLQYYILAAEQGHRGSTYNLANTYWYGKNTEKDKVKAFKFFKIAAEKGHATSQGYLGDIYADHSDLTPKDLKTAFKWYMKASIQGNSYASCEVGKAYYYGHGVKIDYKVAAKFYKKAMDEGKTNAKARLASMYMKGKGVTKDQEYGIKLLKEAAKKENSLAMYNLGWYLYYGKGPIEQDKVKGLKLIQDAADKDNNNAKKEIAKINRKKADEKARLGIRYMKGKGVTKDRERGIKILEEEAKKENPLAMFNFGWYLYYGKGTLQQDKIEGLKLLQAAADKGNKSAKQEIVKINKKNK